MNKKLLLENLRNVPDYPKKGIQFQDVSTLFKNPACIEEMKQELVRLYKDKGITKVVGIESRGFVMARKPGKLPADTFKETYEKEYGFDEIEIHTDAITSEDTVLIHDDLLATGGSMEAVYKLCQRFNPRRIYVNFLIELAMEGLNGRKALGADKDITTLITVSR